MATSTGTNSTATEGEQKENMLSPSEADASALLNGSSAPLKFSDLTPCQFGISAQSFIPPSSNRKSPSRLAQLKARRRSSVGVRGSPETNSLIRFMAQQRMKTPATRQISEHVRSSPLIPRVSSTLRQKMASFQSLMDVEETEVCDPMPRNDSDSGGCVKTRDHLSDDNSSNRGKENSPPTMTPTPSKKRCLAPLEGCEVEIREASAPILHFTLKDQEEDEDVHILTEGPKLSIENVERVQALFISQSLHVDIELQSCSPTNNQQDSAFELPSRSTPDDSAANSPTQFTSPFHNSVLPSLQEMEPKGKNDSTEASTIKKRVRFGDPLSPELFDKNLPPSTPLQKGDKPARVPTPGGCLRSLLKTPQRNESQMPPAQPGLSSPAAFGASPVLAMPRNGRMTAVENDKDRKIVFPAMEEVESVVTSDTEDTWETQPLNLNIAFQEESLSQMVTESEAKPSSTSQMDLLDELSTSADKEKQCDSGAEASSPLQPRNRRKELPGPQYESTGVASTRSSTRKRKQPEDSAPVKRSTRSAALSASGKIKITSTATRRWNRDVDRSLYSSRKYASKNPTLSPITEKLSFVRQSPPSQQTPSAVTHAAVIDQETCLNPDMACDTQAVDEHTLTNSFESPSEGSGTSPHSSKENATVKVARLSWPRVRGRGLKVRKRSVVDCDLLNVEPQHQAGGGTEELWKEKTATTLEASNKIPLEHAVPEQGGVDIEPNGQTSADTDCTSESLSVCPPSGEELHYTLNLPAGGQQSRRSSVSSSSLQEQGHTVEDNQLCCRVEEMGPVEQESSSDNQEDKGVTELHLAPWQCDFNFEDVFKPVATRGQRSVRRSLRNRSKAADSRNIAGLAWMPWTSPDSSEEPRRRTRGRRLSGALPVQPEASHDDAS